MSLKLDDNSEISGEILLEAAAEYRKVLQDLKLHEVQDILLDG